jgi:hypothetical protein
MRVLAAFLLLLPMAHRLDEYLQASRLSLALDRIVLRIDLTPGVEVAPLIFATINTNRDGEISEGEGKAYANQLLKEIVLDVDGRRQPLTVVSSQFPSFREMSSGLGVIRIEAQTAWTGTPGRHSLVYENKHKPDLGVYLVNALVPANPKIAITAQNRDPLQREFRLAFKID